MNCRGVRCLLPVLGLLLSQVLFAQQPSENLNVEAHYLRRFQFQILKEKAFSGDREMKSEALDSLRTMIEEETLGEDKAEAEFILEYLSMEGSTIIERQGNQIVRDFPLIRTRAAYLLGELATEKAENVLSLIVFHDAEPMVKAEAAYALGKMGQDIDAVISLLTFAIGDQSIPDDNFAYAVLLAFEKIIARSRLEIEPHISEALMKIAKDSRYVRKVREKAREVLRILTS